MYARSSVGKKGASQELLSYQLRSSTYAGRPFQEHRHDEGELLVGRVFKLVLRARG